MDLGDLVRILDAMPGSTALLEARSGFPVQWMSRALRRRIADPTITTGRSILELLPVPAGTPERLSTLRASLERVCAMHEPDHCDEHLALIDETTGEPHERVWRITSTPVRGDGGQVVGIVCSVDASRSAGADRSIAVLDALTEGVLTLDQAWRLTYINPEAQRLLGRSSESLLGSVIWEAFPGLEDTPFGEHYRRAMLEREPARFTAYLDGLDSWHEVIAHPSPDGITVFFRDVTPHIVAQQDGESESERQRRLYETALSNTPDFVYIFGADHRAIYANDALRQVWGVDDVRGKTWIELGYEQWHADMHDRELAEVIATKAPIRGEIPFTGTNGRRIYDYIFAPVFNAAGDVVAVAGTTRDITERKAAEETIREHAERLAEADRAKDEFLATLSHELRNPLAPLRNGLEILQRTGADDGPHARIHAMMGRQVDHLVRLVDDLMEVSRITRGQVSLQLQTVDLAAVLDSAIEVARPILEATRHRVVVELPEDPVVLQGDRIRLAQIITNLLTNAAKYSEPGGDIAIQAQVEDGTVRVSVQDSGMGMDPDEIDHLFAMFTRGDRVRATHQGGLGIGLALARRLAHLHGGTLDAQSDGPGHGSTFTLRLPVTSGLVVGDGAASDAPQRRLSHRILIADDNRDVGQSLAETLRLYGAEVTFVDGGAQAIEQFEAIDPTVAIIDIGMPRVTGYDVARTLRTRGVTRPLIALTGWGQASDRARALASGFDHHLVKPVAIAQLVDLLASIPTAAAETVPT